MQYYIASCSFGKDSLAMVLRLIEENKPLDEVVFYDTGMEFQAIYNVRDRLLPLLDEKGIKYAELKPDRPFMYDMLERPKTKRTGEKVCGDGWCGGACRWGTFAKQRALNKYCGNNYTYIGLATDEQRRLENLEAHKHSPLAEWEMTEKDCLEYCRSKGYSWTESSANGDIDLYDILDRVSCWCCTNKNLKELRNIYWKLPQYWERLRNLQSRISRPIKPSGSIFDLERRFLLEKEFLDSGKSINTKEFYDSMKDCQSTVMLRD